MAGSIIILSSFVVGLFLAVFGIVPSDFDFSAISKYILYLLMLLVGLNLGLDKEVVKTIKSQPKRMLLLPFSTMAGTFAGAVLAWGILRLASSLGAFGGLAETGSLSLADSLSVGAGFGYYSLSSIFLNEARGAEIGTIALAANILRELITIAFAPLMVRFFGKLAPISSGGATSMDTTLPIIQKTAGNEYVPLSIFHGVVVDFSVPLFLTFFISLG